jgi:hypothetical protein
MLVIRLARVSAPHPRAQARAETWPSSLETLPSPQSSLHGKRRFVVTAKKKNPAEASSTAKLSLVRPTAPVIVDQTQKIGGIIK